MNEIKSLIDLITKISLKDLGVHLANIANLYAKPFSTWRKIISNRKTSYNFFLLFVIYYSFLVLLIVQDVKWVVPLTIFELVITLIPFFIVILPFIFFRNRWQKRLKSDKLFKLLFIVKIQFSLILILPILLLIKWTKMESLFILFDNFMFINWLAIISSLPIILNIKLFQKLIWIFTNYIFTLFFFALTAFIAQYFPDINLFEEKVSISTPTQEYNDFKIGYNYSDYWIDEKYFTILITLQNDKEHFRNTQFTTSHLALEIMNVNSENIKTRNKAIDSLSNLYSLSKLKSNKKEIERIAFGKKIITTKKMDSLKLHFNKSFYSDIKFTDSLIKHCKFESNRNLFLLHNRLLKHIDSLYTASKYVGDIIKTQPICIVKSDNNNYIILHEFKNSEILQMNKEIDLLETKFRKREEYSDFMLNVFTFPLKKIIDLIENLASS